MRRYLSAGLVAFWLVMLAVLLYRTWPVRSSRPMVPERVESAVGEEWMGVYQGQRKIGYTRNRLTAEAAGFVFLEEALLRLTVAGTPQTVRTRMEGHTNPDFALRDISFELGSGVGDLHASGTVSGKSLHLTLRTGAEESEQTIALKDPLYVPSTLRASVRAGGLQPGRHVEAMVFDPTTLQNDRLQLTVEREEVVPGTTADAERGWRVREEFHGLVTTAWIDPTGVVLREEGPLGLTLVHESAEAALQQGWETATALDLVAKAAVPVARRLDDPRQRTALRVRLSGIAEDQIPSDDEQVRQGSVLAITTPDVASLASYRLPYRGLEQASDVAPTVFLQSDHPRIRALAREILGGEQDAKRAAVRLNDWVYEHLRKVPTISIPNALQVLDMGEGDCNEHAVLLAALGRASGLPTRLIAGAVYVDGAFFYHAWCEVWLERWVSIDPALHQFPADATHIKLVVGDPEEQMKMLGIIGRLGVEVLGDGQESGG